MPKHISLVFLAKKPEYFLRAAQVLSACLGALAALFLPVITTAQPITSDGSTGTVVTPNSNPTVYDITGGQLSQDGKNLFHSFTQFGLDANQTANFLSNPSILNILGRVIGGNPSIINGLIQVTGGNSNLFLINPAGIIFGANSSLNVPADFTATTATRIGFGNNTWFNAIGTNNYATLVGTPSIFAFESASTPGAIINAGQLNVPAGSNLSLLGGTVVNTGQLTASGGNITVAAVPGQNLIRISQTGHLLNLEIQSCSNNPNCPLASASNSLLPNPLALPQLLTGLASSQATGLTVDSTGQVILTNSGVVVPPTPGTVVFSGNTDASSTTAGQIGGSVQLRGNLIGLVESAQVNVSGDGGGGQVLIGADVRGSDTAPNELRAFVGPEVTINANAGTTGNGGEVRIQADNAARVLGTIQALGGSTAGNGGVVEVSGTRSLTFNSLVDTSAASGQRGQLFLNSANFALIDAPNPAPNRNLANNPEILRTDNPTGANLLSWGQIDTLLSSNNLVLQGNDGIAIADIAGNTPPLTQNNLVSLGQQAGSLTLDSTTGAITFQDQNDTIQTSGSPLTLNAATNINAGNFLTNGGEVRLQSQRGNLTTGQIDTRSSSGNGGNVTLEAAKGSITTGQIDTRSSSGDGGRVSINAQQRIIVNSIDTRSLGNGRGGTIDITTPSLFQASGTNGDNTSLATGGARGGSINIRHGGGTLGIPFTVGSDYNGINGTAGAIVTDGNTQIRSGTFTNPFTQGTPPSQIQFITPRTQSDAVSQVQIADAPNPPAPQPSEVVLTPPPVAVNREVTVAEVEQSFTQEFEQYFGRSLNAGNQDLTQTRETLEQIDRVTGSTPALIYAVFVSADVDSQTSAQTSIPRSTDELELILVTAQGNPIRKRIPGATRARVLNIAREFRSNVTNIQRPSNYLRYAQQLYKWLVEPLESELQAENINNLAFISDSGLRAIPMSALHDGQGFLIERYSVALMPSFSLTDTRYRSLNNVQVLAMGADQFPNQKPLPAVPVELSVITQQLWQGKAFLNNAFTLENLKAQRQQGSFGIIHLATHADFQSGSPNNSYIQLSNGKLRLNQMPQLNWSNPPVELLVLSACRTAVGNAQAELGFAGLAVQSGVKSAVASLWMVSDEATLGLMTEFYRQLKNTPIKAEALRQAQLALLKGQVRIESGKLYSPQGEVPLPPALAELGDRELTHPYYWAAFTLIGNPW
jgi:filamentous hemagglutinin family protein